MAHSDAPGTAGMQGTTSRVFPLLAVTAGLAVGNVYAVQPLLGSISASLRIAPGDIGWVVTMTQVGYAFGLVFIVPMGDLGDRRKLILALGLVTSLALVIVASARGPWVLFAGVVAVGLTAVLAQVSVTYAAALATPAARGRAIGGVTTGIVAGILGARFVAGFLADLGGWRCVYVTSAMLMLLTVALMARTLPPLTLSEASERYGIAVRSVPRLFLHDRTLMVRGLLALLIFASFSTFWTAMVLPLSQPPFSYSHTTIGLFGLVGIAGAVAASGAGRLADRGFTQSVTGLSLAMLAGSWILIALLPYSIAMLVAGVVLLDLAVQAVHVSSQSLLLARHPHVGSRLIGGYMVFYSTGSGLGAIGATVCFARGGWFAVTLLGEGFALAALTVWLVALPDRRGR